MLLPTAIVVNRLATDSQMRTRIGVADNVYWTPVNLLDLDKKYPLRTICHVVKLDRETDAQHQERCKKLMEIIDAGITALKQGNRQ